MKVLFRAIACFLLSMLMVLVVGCSNSAKVNIQENEKDAPTASQEPTDPILGSWKVEGIGIYEFKQEGVLTIHFNTGDTLECQYIVDGDKLTFDLGENGESVNTFLIEGQNMRFVTEYGDEFKLSKQ